MAVSSLILNSVLENQDTSEPLKAFAGVNSNSFPREDTLLLSTLKRITNAWLLKFCIEKLWLPRLLSVHCLHTEVEIWIVRHGNINESWVPCWGPCWDTPKRTIFIRTYKDKIHTKSIKLIFSVIFGYKNSVVFSSSTVWPSYRYAYAPLADTTCDVAPVAWKEKDFVSQKLVCPSSSESWNGLSFYVATCDVFYM